MMNLMNVFYYGFSNDNHHLKLARNMALSLANFKPINNNVLKKEWVMHQNKLKINKVTVTWAIRINQNNRSSWKNIHTKGGGILYNYIWLLDICI